MEKRIDQHLLKISGKAYLGTKLPLGADVEVVVRGSVVKEEAYDNQDGTVNLCYTVKPLTVKVEFVSS